MARYTDLDEIIAKLDADTKDPNEMFPIHWIKTWLNMQPTADVVPKSEVERLQIEIEALKIANEKMYEAFKTQPREIFEEIEKRMLNGEIGGKYPTKVISPDTYAELKKKYTEESHE